MKIHECSPVCTLVLCKVAAALELIPADSGRAAGNTPDKSPAHHIWHVGTSNQTFIWEWPVNLTWMWTVDMEVHSGRKLEYQEGTHTDTGWTCRLCTERLCPSLASSEVPDFTMKVQCIYSIHRCRLYNTFKKHAEQLMNIYKERKMNCSWWSVEDGIRSLTTSGMKLLRGVTVWQQVSLYHLSDGSGVHGLWLGGCCLIVSFGLCADIALLWCR